MLKIVVIVPVIISLYFNNIKVIIKFWVTLMAAETKLIKEIEFQNLNSTRRDWESTIPKNVWPQQATSIIRSETVFVYHR